MNKQIEELIQRLKEPDYQFYGCELCKSEAELAISALEKQLNNGWIPVSKKMPEFDQNCLVTTDTEEVFTSKFFGYGEEYQGYREYPEGVWEINQCDLEVIAWQSLPEPYKEVSE